MADFIFKTHPRGYMLVFPQERWDHAVLDRGHFTKTKGVYPQVMDAFARSTLVLKNVEPVGMRIDGPPRMGNEVYVSPFGPNEWLIIPVVTKAVPTVIGTVTVGPPIAIGWTAFTDTKIPDGEVLWKWPPDPE